jgi:hypothetical protein
MDYIGSVYWEDKELWFYSPPDDMALDRAKRLWYQAMRDYSMENLDNMFNLEPFTERVDWRLKF